MRRTLLFLVLVFLLAACNLPASTPTEAIKPSETALPQASPTVEPTPTPAGRSLVKVADLPETLDDAYRGIAVLADGGLLLYTSNWVARFEAPDGWTAVAETLGDEELIGLDAQGRAFAAPPGAATISVWRDGVWTTFGEAQGWAPINGDYAWDGAVGSQRPVLDGQGRAWLETAQDVRVFDGQGWQVFSAEALDMAISAPGDAYIEFKLLYDPQSEAMWLMECDWGGPGPVGGGGVRRYLNGVWQGADWPVGSGCASALALAEDGAVWAAVQPSVWRFDPLVQEWTSLGAPLPPEESRPGYALEIVPDALGGAWIVHTFCGGASCGNVIIVARWQEGAWVMLKDGKDFAYYSLIPYAGGTAYLLVNNQLNFLGENQIDPISDLSIVDWAVGPGGLLYWVASDKSGMSVWVEK